MMEVRRRTQSESALYCSSHARCRSRASTLVYERGKDKLAFWVGSCDSDTICALLEALIARCSLHQLSYLWTAMESVPHRDMLSMLNRAPLSTPTSREVTKKLARSQLPENTRLYRTKSTIINDQLQNIPPGSIVSRPISPDATNVFKLPGLWHTPTHSTLSHLIHPSHTRHAYTRLQLDAPTSRVQTPARRHMAFDPLLSPPSRLPKRAFVSPRSKCRVEPLPKQVLDFLSWFRDLQEDWQQQELLQLIVTNLDCSELYHLATLLMSRQYRDFVSHLPEQLVVMVMAFVPAKDILRNCCLVSSDWRVRCSSEPVWQLKVSQRKMGLPLSNFLSWKKLYLDDLRLRKNWALGLCTIRDLSDSSKVLCMRLRNGLLVTGGADRIVRLWKVVTGEIILKLYGHLRSVWSVCFYGKCFIISGSGDHTIKVWNTRTGTCERTLRGHEGTVWALQQRGETLISGGHDKMVCVYCMQLKRS